MNDGMNYVICLWKKHNSQFLYFYEGIVYFVYGKNTIVYFVYGKNTIHNSFIFMNDGINYVFCLWKKHINICDHKQ
jgi:hypothetical protein